MAEILSLILQGPFLGLIPKAELFLFFSPPPCNQQHLHMRKTHQLLGFLAHPAAFRLCKLAESAWARRALVATALSLWCRAQFWAWWSLVVTRARDRSGFTSKCRFRGSFSNVFRNRGKSHAKAAFWYLDVVVGSTLAAKRLIRTVACEP